MRSPIYFMAALAAAGIAYFLASSPVQETASGDSVVATETASVVMEQPGTLTLRVDDMHCEFGCFPTVRKTLEGVDKVVSVQLDKQAEAGTLDNPQVVVSYESGFDLSQAQSLLAEKGFAKSSLVP